jgi:hypothetical protein
MPSAFPIGAVIPIWRAPSMLLLPGPQSLLSLWLEPKLIVPAPAAVSFENE